MCKFFFITWGILFVVVMLLHRWANKEAALRRQKEEKSKEPTIIHITIEKEKK